MGISKEERDECRRRCQVYRKWLPSKIFSTKSKDSIKIMVLPIEACKPNYRDSPEPPYGLLNGYASLNMSPITRAPEITAIGRLRVYLQLHVVDTANQGNEPQ
ncbi:unnamed protein product [Clonostachys rhizophaga]|uniref:Uncharacterized protein n=1 Tax=Clonostachys rhizophaga TaxID=160324 RepID=A0A9N9YK46_9HYPO|nr:unnamed protein product [Clonostachys rhizophaga]